MAVHAISHKPLGIVYVGRRFPGIVGKLDFVAGSAELRCGSAHHGVVGNTEYGEGNEKSKCEEYSRLPNPFQNPKPQGGCSLGACFGLIHLLPKKNVWVRLNGLAWNEWKVGLWNKRNYILI